MFAGHAALALALKPRLPRQSLGVLFAATFWLDLVWPVFLLLGIERVRIDPGNTAFTPLAFEHYPWTHSLLVVVGWSLLFALVVLRFRFDQPKAFAALFLLVLSHWVLDLASHRPDLPLSPGSSVKLGLGLWNSVPATLVVEGLLFVVAVTVYVRKTSARDRIGLFGLWSLLGFVFLVWVSSPFAPPPPNAQAIAVVGLLSWLLPLWAHWADSHRNPSPAHAATAG